MDETVIQTQTTGITVTPETTGKSELSVRKDYVLNDCTISEAFFKYVLDYKHYPTNTQLACLTGFSEKTIRNHLRTIDIEEMTSSARLFGSAVLYAVMNRALANGDPRAAKLYFQIAFNWDGEAIPDGLPEEPRPNLEERCNKVLDHFEKMGLDFEVIWEERKMQRQLHIKSINVQANQQ